ncbi:hypothetical protein [Kordia sp.]|uniref:hypothetical protein n=1 Tax=Kordia sp. TaxID=1965332 RepID=UPI003D6AD814
MKKRNFKTLAIRKENIVSLNESVSGGAQPTTGQSTVAPTNEGKVCELTPAICPTNWFDC